MKLLAIKENLQRFKIFTLNDILKIDPNFQQPLLYDWEKKGYIKKLRNNRYIFSDFQPRNWDFYLIANKLYSPSYISLELALNHYGIIPEAVLQYTSITTLKTQSFDTELGTFSYRTIKKELFWGYNVIQNENTEIKIANLEKTILDYLYLNPQVSSSEDFEGLRFNKIILKNNLNFELIDKYLKIFDQKSLNSRTLKLLDYIKNT